MAQPDCKYWSVRDCKERLEYETDESKPSRTKSCFTSFEERRRSKTAINYDRFVRNALPVVDTCLPETVAHHRAVLKKQTESRKQDRIRRSQQTEWDYWTQVDTEGCQEVVDHKLSPHVFRLRAVLCKRRLAKEAERRCAWREQAVGRPHICVSEYDTKRFLREWACLQATVRSNKLKPPSPFTEFEKLLASLPQLPRVTLKLKSGDEQGSLVIQLNGDSAITPIANFIALTEGIQNADGSRHGYDNSQLGRMVPNAFWMFGRGCKSNLHCGPVDPQCSQLRHCEKGIVSMFNDGQNNFSGPFVILAGPVPVFDCVHIPIGNVVSGLEFLENLQEDENCGAEVPQRHKPNVCICSAEVVLGKKPKKKKNQY